MTTPLRRNSGGFPLEVLPWTHLWLCAYASTSQCGLLTVSSTIHTPELAVLRLLRHLPKLVRGSSGGSSCLLHAYGSLVQASASRQSLYAHVGWRGWCANGPGLSQVSRRLSYRECAILTSELPQPHPAQVPSTRDCPSITLIDITLIHCAFFSCWPAQALPAALCFTRYCSQLCDLVQL